MTEQRKCCKNCAASQPAVGPDGRIDFGKRFCRRNPPTVVTMLKPNEPPTYPALWPVMGAMDVCWSWVPPEPPLPGEFKPSVEVAEGGKPS